MARIAQQLFSCSSLFCFALLIFTYPCFPLPLLMPFVASWSVSLLLCAALFFKKDPQNTPKISPDPCTDRPRPAQDRPRWPQDRPRSHQDSPRPPKTAPRPPRTASRTAPDLPKTTRDDPQTAPTPPKTAPSWAPRWLRKRYGVKNVIFQKVLKNARKINDFEPQIPPKTTLDDPKSAPRPPRKRPRPAKTAPRPPQDRPRRPKTATTTPHDRARPPQDRPRAKKDPNINLSEQEREAR